MENVRKHTRLGNGTHAAFSRGRFAKGKGDSISVLAIAVGSWFGHRAAGWDEVRILVLLEIALTVLSTAAGLWGLLFRGAPVFAWVTVVIWVVFAVAWIYFYVNRPAPA